MINNNDNNNDDKAITTTSIKAKINDTLQNCKCKLCDEETSKHLMSECNKQVKR